MREVLNKLNNKALAHELLAKVRHQAGDFQQKFKRIPAFMEVCGTHTHMIAKNGVRAAVAGEVKLISGPGCPVCVTAQTAIDAMISLTKIDNAIICTFGDMIRVPGSKGQTLQKAKSAGKDVRIVYNPQEAVTIAKNNPDKEVIFLGVGFETTIPLLAATIETAVNLNLQNYSLWLNVKLLEPICRHLLEDEEIKLDGFILPGHVSIVTGGDFYSFLCDEYNVSGVISGFETAEVLSSLSYLLNMKLNNDANIVNNYKFIVTNKGNDLAKAMIEKYFTHVDEEWRGIGIIPKSGMVCKEAYKCFDAKVKFSIDIPEAIPTKCRCGLVIQGKIVPSECPLFAKSCTPRNPIGPCMVSSEGSCAAYYNFATY